jgi:phosphoribosyl 1,2-cyclic phosphodiesterase
MKIKIWGCRGSIPSPGSEKVVYGGNTSCVQIIHDHTCIILDGGSGIQNVGMALGSEIKEVHLLLTHLHIDHIIGLGFFIPFYNPTVKVTIWGPGSSRESLTHRLRRYFSPPIFPVRLNELPCGLDVKEIGQSRFEIDDFIVESNYVCHPGPTVGYRIQLDTKVLTYIPDHEPTLGSAHFPNCPEWTSGYGLAKEADLLLHDGQYKTSEYKKRIGWGHSTMYDAIRFGNMCGVKKLVLFHHDPLHTDTVIEQLFDETLFNHPQSFAVELGKEGEIYTL